MRIASALRTGGSYTYEDARREAPDLSEEELRLAWLTANRRVDNEADLV